MAGTGAMFKPSSFPRLVIEAGCNLGPQAFCWPQKPREVFFCVAWHPVCSWIPRASITRQSPGWWCLACYALDIRQHRIVLSSIHEKSITKTISYSRGGELGLMDGVSIDLKASFKVTTYNMSICVSPFWSVITLSFLSYASWLFFWPGCLARGILVPKPRIVPVPHCIGRGRVLTPGPPGKSL